ncbi:hypothetical protein FACS1894122_01790 [Alphaproteobacteria bacterium]|nr:hypothetical protein FACS1894122_01790 [Alphaproteobacteria bacterium]
MRALNGLTPFEFVAKKLQKDPKTWVLSSGHDEAGPNAKIMAGAGFVVTYAGDIVTMPGLPRYPAAESIDIDEKITGLS